MLHFARRMLTAAGTLLVPPCCVVCSADTEPRVHLCKRCAGDVRRITAPRCERCSQPFDGAITEVFTCDNCGGREVHYECAVAPYVATGTVRELIHHFKYRSDLFLVSTLGGWLADALEDPRIACRPIDALVPVPLHHVRFREREFNQAAELAAFLTKRTAIPTWHALKRTRYTTTQTRLSRAERMENLRGAFRVRQTERVKGQHIVLVDDVFTTGSTVDECSRVLLRAGAASVRVITVARG